MHPDFYAHKLQLHCNIAAAAGLPATIGAASKGNAVTTRKNSDTAHNLEVFSAADDGITQLALKTCRRERCHITISRFAMLHAPSLEISS
jgi:hypothetical protein